MLLKLNRDAKKYITEQAAKFDVDLSSIEIFASNDLNEPALLDLKAKVSEHFIIDFLTL